MYNYSKLNGRIKEMCGTQTIFAKKMKLSDKSISLKLNNKAQFKQNEINKAIKILNIQENEIGLYFFALNVKIS